MKAILQCLDKFKVADGGTRQMAVFMLGAVTSLAHCLFPGPLASQNVESEASVMIDRFNLYTACSRINLQLVVQDKSASLQGFTTVSLRPTVTSRLRSARIYQNQTDYIKPFLFVSVNVVKSAFGIDINFNKNLFDQFTDLTLFAETWSWGMTGAHGGNAQRLRGSVAEGVDTFIDEYLRVNESACGVD